MEAGNLERRRKVWEALSDLFLDTETRWFLPQAALTLIESRYDAAELERIWRYEITPECAWNLFLVAGEWATMPIDEARLIRRAAADKRVLANVLDVATSNALGAQWEQLNRLRDRLLQLPEDRRKPYASVWSSFVKAYLEENLDKIPTLDKEITALQEANLPKEDCVDTFEKSLRPVCAALLAGDEKKTESARAENVRSLIERAFR